MLLLLSKAKPLEDVFMKKLMIHYLETRQTTFIRCGKSSCGDSLELFESKK